ncbi:MAG: hypothetical protein U0835_21485 [Isosphaeraceae bacterium]
MRNARSAAKSPLALARAALASARETLPEYSSKFSRHDYTQHQLYAVLALRDFLKVDYRGLEEVLREWAELRDALSLSRVPDHTTLHKAARRLCPKSKPRASAPKANEAPDWTLPGLEVPHAESPAPVAAEAEHAV